MAEQTIYVRILTITEDYLGPAAPRFIEHLVKSHLDKPVDSICEADLPDLVVWIRMAAMVVSDDADLVKEYVGRLEQLVDQRLSLGLHSDPPNHTSRS